MSAIGQELRKARLAQKLTEQQVGEITKLRADHVLSVEEGNYDVFPARVYLRGFVRTYARLLKLDVETVLKQLDQELETSTTHRDPPALTPQNHGLADAIMFQLSKINWKVMAPIIIVSLVILGAVWGIRTWQQAALRDPLAGLPEGYYRPERPMSIEVLAIPSAVGTNR